MGVHTGDSYCIAPMLTIDPELQQRLQKYSYAIVPDGSIHRIKLQDNGNWRVNGDDRKHDGVYSARFAKTDLQGTYRISVTVNSRTGETAVPDEVRAGWRPKKIAPFVRSAKCSFAVGRREVKPPIWERPPQVDWGLPQIDRFSGEVTASDKTKNLKGPKK